MRPYKLVPLVAALLSINLYAQPVVEDIRYVDDQYIEIRGKNFGSKNEAKPLVWMDFEEQNHSLFSRLQSLSKVNGAISSVGDFALNPGASDDSVSINAFLKFDAKVGNSGGPSEISFNSDTLYVNLRRNYQFDLSDPKLTASAQGLNLKTLRMWASFQPPNVNNMYLGYQGREGKNSGRIVGEYTDEKTNWLGGTAPFVGFEWINEELIYKTSDINQANGVFQYIRNGIYAKSEGERHRTTDRPQRYSMLFFDQISNYTLTNSLEILYDDIYVDDTYSRVVLTDSKNSRSYSRAIPQIPVEWRDDFIKVKINRSNSQSKEFFLYVYNRENESNLSGIRFCPECPKPPIK